MKNRNYYMLILLVLFTGCSTYTSSGYGPNTQAIIHQEENLSPVDKERNQNFYKAKYGARCENAGFVRDSDQYFDCLGNFYRANLQQRLEKAIALDQARSQYASDLMWNGVLNNLQQNQYNYNGYHQPKTTTVCESAYGRVYCSNY